MPPRLSVTTCSTITSWPSTSTVAATHRAPGDSAAGESTARWLGGTETDTERRDAEAASDEA